MRATPSGASDTVVHSRAQDWKRTDGRAGNPGAEPILVVDDDPMCCRVMASALELAGHRVDWTTAPADALERARTKRYAVIVSDVNMPSMLGTALAAEVGTLCPGVRMILVSAFADAGVRAAAEALGATLLAKPFRVESLVAAVREIMDGAGVSRVAP
jgi:DNA-binding NtrC family response regulator